jgi:hypothetical protein
VAPEALNETVDPEHIVAAPEADTVIGLTDTEVVAVPLQA